MRKRTAIALCASMILSLCACGSTQQQAVSSVAEPRPVEETAASEQEEYESLVPEGDFDGRLLSYISEHAEGNYMVSPLSYRLALGLLLEGAQGDTKKELLHAMGVESVEEWRDFCRIPDSEVIRVANSIWKNEALSAEFKEDYIKSVEANYDGSCESFTPKNGVERINRWAEEKTEGLIPEILSKDSSLTDTAAVLMNALYLKDSWVKTFAEGATRDEIFHTAAGGVSTKSFMMKMETVSYYADENTRLVVIPMEGGTRMAVVLGENADIAEKIEKAEDQWVEMHIPKLDLETSFHRKELINFLKAYGVKSAFDPVKADFGSMMDTPVRIDDIVQKTRLKLDENGVEAAAVTAVIAKFTSAVDVKKPIEFYADQPFSFYIYNEEMGPENLLFAGEIVE